MRTVHFTRDFDFHADANFTIAYLAGYTLEVDEECAELAIACGAAYDTAEEVE